MAPDIRMYGKSVSSGVEAMNRANKLVREKTAVDPLNAAILLPQLEGDRFNKWKLIAWATDMPLAPKGMDLMKEAFNDVAEYVLSNVQYQYFGVKVHKWCKGVLSDTPKGSLQRITFRNHGYHAAFLVNRSAARSVPTQCGM